VSDELRVIDWVMDDDDRVQNAECSVGGMGGWVDGEQWPEFIDAVKEEKRPYYEALRKSIIERRIWKAGDWHQRDAGTPLFSDGTVGSFTFRSWGDLLAAIWNGALDRTDLSYMSFYYLDTEEEPTEWPTIT
jgi:hypothetical protein